MKQRNFWSVILVLVCAVLLTGFLNVENPNLFSLKTVSAAEIAGGAQEALEAEEIRLIYTTEQALSYTFGGVMNEKVTNDVLERLHKLNIKATFFVTEAEMKNNSELIRKIISNGHEIGIAVRPRNTDQVDDICQAILRAQKMLKEQFWVETDLVKQPYGAIESSTKIAVKKAGCKLIGHSVNVVQGKHQEYTSADAVMSEIFGKAVHSLARGQIVHFRMDYYKHDYLIGQLLEIIKERKIDNISYEASYDNPDINPLNDSRYMIKPVGQILNNKKFTYQYPINPENVPLKLRTDAPKQTDSWDSFISEVSKRYIGSIFVSYDNASLGFSRKEDRRLDKTGLVQTNENVIFITFDDWGTDAAVNKLLYVLRKHDVKCAFFVLTNNVLANPNLLRAIAEEGHEIANHSDKHLPMARFDAGTQRYVLGQSKEEYVAELATSYKKLVDVVGDVTYESRPVLHRYFRPPTLAISKPGVEAIFENNFEYIVSGSYSTGDYQLKDIAACLNVLKQGIYDQNGKVIPGATIVMHFSDTAIYTPMALDILLTANALKDDADPSKFKVGKLSDYLKEGYEQQVLKK